MSLEFSTGGPPAPSLATLLVVAGRLVATFLDGTTRDVGPAPVTDTTGIAAIAAANATAISQLQAARDAHTASIASSQSAIAALQAAAALDESHISDAQAAIAALSAKVTADEATVAGIAAAVATLQAAKTADEQLIALLQTDVASLKASRTTDEAAIAAAQTAITSLQASRTTDEAAIAANGTAIAALQTAKTADEAAIASNGTAIAGLLTRQNADETNIANLQTTAASNAGRITALEAGAPAVLGLARIVVASVDSAAEIGRYRVLRPALGRTYTFSLVNPSAANVLSITAAGILSTVAAGFNALASEGTATVTVRATDDQGATFDLALTILRRVPAAALPGSTRRVYVSSVEITSSNANYNLAGIVPAGATECLVECVSGGASGYSSPSGGDFGGHGGCPGQATQKVFRVADLPSTLAVTIGAGGVVGGPYAGFALSAEGGDTIFGSLLQAKGGLKGSYTSLSDPIPSQPSLPGSVPSGRAGLASTHTTNGNGNFDYLSAQPSMGPGAGGAGRWNGATSSDASGYGGDGASHLPGSRTQGGTPVAISGSQTSLAGQNAYDVWGYGAGGAGGGGGGGTNNTVSAGGLPGGGGGGGGASNGSGSVGCIGGRGAVRLHFYKYEAP